MKKLAIPILAGLLYGAFDYYQLRSLSKIQSDEIIQLTIKYQGLRNVALQQAECILKQDTTIEVQAKTIQLAKANMLLHERLEATIERRAAILQETVDALMYGPKLRNLQIIRIPRLAPPATLDTASIDYTHY